jgi:hypothetical protein
VFSTQFLTLILCEIHNFYLLKKCQTNWFYAFLYFFFCVFTQIIDYFLLIFCVFSQRYIALVKKITNIFWQSKNELSTYFVSYPHIVDNFIHMCITMWITFICQHSPALSANKCIEYQSYTSIHKDTYTQILVYLYTIRHVYLYICIQFVYLYTAKSHAFNRINIHKNV